MKKPRRLLWLLVPAAAGIVCVSVGFAAWQTNYFDNNAGTVEESLYTVTYHYKDGTGSEQTPSFTGLEYNSDFDLKVLPNEWATANGKPADYIFAGWSLNSNGTEPVYTNSVAHTVKILWDSYSTKPTNNTIDLYCVWSQNV